MADKPQQFVSVASDTKKLHIIRKRGDEAFVPFYGQLQTFAIFSCF